MSPMLLRVFLYSAVRLVTEILAMTNSPFVHLAVLNLQQYGTRNSEKKSGAALPWQWLNVLGDCEQQLLGYACL